ncbi:MAG: diguanylate cyclase [Luminiphilus sp.]|nr:diguanylate cyclase [Luminiphilus sp.]
MRHEWGGEEFIIFYPAANRSTVLEAAENLRRRIAELDIPHEKSLTAPHVTISIGVVSCVPEWELEFEVLLKASDDALYLSKTNGRNRITFGEVDAPDES